tara:strand:+ start:481 stop:1080 length:600 start_codon:yes stop_codon:yes gene_type:complete
MKRSTDGSGKTVIHRTTVYDGDENHPDDDDHLPASCAARHAATLGFSDLCELIVNDLVPDARGRTPEVLLAETAAWDLHRLRECVAAQFLGEVPDGIDAGEGVDGGSITLEGEVEGFEVEEGVDDVRDCSLDESLASRFARLGPNMGRAVLSPLALRAEESRLTKQLMDKVRMIRKNDRSRMLNHRDRVSIDAVLEKMD